MHNTYICREKIHVCTYIKTPLLTTWCKTISIYSANWTMNWSRNWVYSNIVRAYHSVSRHILYHIKNNISLSIQELADFLHVEHSTMSRNIKKLVQAGLVDIYQDEKDKRRKVITLSAAGESRLAEATDSINETISKILEVLDDEEIEIVIHGIHRYCEALKGNW